MIIAIQTELESFINHKTTVDFNYAEQRHSEQKNMAVSFYSE